MSYSVGFHVGESRQCSLSGCKAGTLIVPGQLEFNFQAEGNTRSGRHLDCLGTQLKHNIRNRHKTPEDLPGYKNLKPGDKDRVRKSIGWGEDAASTSGNQNNNNRSGGKNEPKANPRAKVSENKASGNAPGSSNINSMRQPPTRPMSPAQSESWNSNLPSWDDSEPPQAAQKNTRNNRGRGREDVNRQEMRRNVQPERNVEPVPPSAGASHLASWWSSKPTVDEDEWRNATPSISNDNRSEMDYPAANSGPPAPPKSEIDPAVLMRLELEDKEAEARLAEAELQLAETRVKVEAARRAVVAQKLMMAKAGVSPSS